MKNIIEFKNVNKTYPNGTHALKNINIDIKEGEFVSIIGLSGSGKSTLLRTVNRMHEISTGTILINNKNIAEYKGKELRNFRHTIGMVFQHFNLVNKETSLNNILISKAKKMNFWQTIFKQYSKQDQLKGLEILDNLHILNKAFVRVDQLSGGQRQRVALGRTLMQNPKIILADEPIASLDPKSAKMIMDDFKKINKDENITILANMHHVDTALKYSDKIIGINDGKVVYFGTSKDVSPEIIDLIYQHEVGEHDTNI